MDHRGEHRLLVAENAQPVVLNLSKRNVLHTAPVKTRRFQTTSKELRSVAHDEPRVGRNSRNSVIVNFQRRR